MLSELLSTTLSVQVSFPSVDPILGTQAASFDLVDFRKNPQHPTLGSLRYCSNGIC